jgi:uncharacterized membrane protein
VALAAGFTAASEGLMDTIQTLCPTGAVVRNDGAGIGALHCLAPGDDPEQHPTIDNVNALLKERLSPTEHICRKIAAMTGAPAALVAAIVLQFVWIGVGLATNWDPYPFVFLLTCSNVIQLILIFVIAVAQRQLSLHDELRAEADHRAISRLLYHQEAQELLLVRLAEKLDVDTRDLSPILSTLSGKGDLAPSARENVTQSR